ncbi:MAG TPA: DUF3298 and DUF4163 domain-containing protein [Firmicutes bacterium]|nr:DUF3298 and DUF4163 domain-containing protein [Bacillota bacterium]
MRKRLMFVLVLAVILGACPGVRAETLWDRMGKGFPNREQVYEYVYELRSPQLQIDVALPQIIGAADAAWQGRFNQKLLDFAEQFTAELREIAHQSEQAGFEFHAPFEGIIRFDLKLNSGGLSSLVIQTYTYTGGAHGMTVRDYINLDLTTGEHLRFRDFFATEAELERAAEIINAKVVAEPQRFFIREFTADEFLADQDFYLESGRAVICFGLYEIGPYVAGIQEFAVSAP